MKEEGKYIKIKKSIIMNSFNKMLEQDKIKNLEIENLIKTGKK